MPHSNRAVGILVTFHSHAVDDVGKYNKPIHYDHGCGIAVADVDGDGRLDLYFVNQLGGNELWRNLGNGKFENITASAEVGLNDRICVGASFGSVMPGKTMNEFACP